MAIPHRLILVHLSLTLIMCQPARGAELAVETLLEPSLVDVEGDRNIFATPVAYREGFVFTVHVVPGDSGKDGVNLRTEVKRGYRSREGGWVWETRIIESRTIRDPWHTQASIAVDQAGHVHVAYNMHNMPWQYSVSERPLDISSFHFRGDLVTPAEIETVKFANRIRFPNIGSAAIPGNQVTYPMFFTDRQGDLYVTYRFALKPARAWGSRAFAGGVAKYDAWLRKWHPIGGGFPVGGADAVLAADSAPILYPFAYDPRYTVYLVTLAFDWSNGVHAVWTWREGGAGMETTDPSYAYAKDGKQFFTSSGKLQSLPINVRQADLFAVSAATKEYYAPKSIAVDRNGDTLVIVHPVGGVRQLWQFSRAQGRWLPPSDAPGGASEIVVDRGGNQWAFASGLKIFVRRYPSAQWTELGTIRKGLCYPRVTYVESEHRFIVHAKSCDGQYASIYSFSALTAENASIR